MSHLTGTRATLDRQTGSQRLPRYRMRWAPWSSGVVTAAAVWVLLVLKNPALFTVPVVEDGDFAANSLLIEQARQLNLLHGHYSRIGFYHPGPGFLYVQAAGEAVFYDFLGIVPAPFNGQMLASLALNAVWIGLVAALLHSWTGDLRVAAVGAVTTLALLAQSEPALVSAWMPFLFIAPFLVFLLACSSVATGRWRHLWLVAGAGGLLVHGHVEFALFVPVLTTVAVVVGLRSSRESLRAAAARAPRAWLAAAGVLLVFVAPVLLNLLLNFPEPVYSYLAYSAGDASPGHPWAASFAWALQFLQAGVAADLFWPTVAAVLVVAAAQHGPEDQRPLLRRLVLVAAVAFVLLVVYAKVGVDNLAETYVGYFAWAIPLLLALGALLGPVTRLERGLRAWVVIGLGCASLLLPAVTGPELVSPERGDPDVATAATAALARRTSPDQPVVMHIDPATWPDTVGVLLAARRQGGRACVSDRRWKVLMTEQMICSPEERRRGVHVDVARASAKMPVPGDVVARTADAVLTVR